MAGASKGKKGQKGCFGSNLSYFEKRAHRKRKREEARIAKEKARKSAIALAKRKATIARKKAEKEAAEKEISVG